jgi:Uma2 family endonuclease
MNLHIRKPEAAPLASTTRAAEGMERRAFTVADVEHMIEAGILGHDERFELIGGEIVPMAAKGAWHENVKRALMRHWIKALPPELEALTETTLRASRIDFREPDFIFWPSNVAVADLAPSHVQLIVEISDSSLDYDLGDKMRYYASLGLPDYWVVDAKRLVTHIHRGPSQQGYASVDRQPHTVSLTPLLVPALAVCLAALGLEPVFET